MSGLIRHGRDPRIDFFRGLALWSMFIDHLIKGWLRAITVKQFAFSDSAELFVLLSGISAGLVYRRALLRHGSQIAQAKILRRVFSIYRAHLVFFVLFIAEAGLLVSWLKPPAFLDFLNLMRLEGQPFQSFFNLIILRYQPKFFDILPLYLALLLGLCCILPLTKRPRVLLAFSIALYVLTRVFQLGLPPWLGVWYFNPLAWQVIFMIGVAATGFLPANRYWRGWDWMAAGFCLFSLVESHAKYLAHRLPAALLISFEADKPSLHPFRVLAIVSLAWIGWRYLPASANLFRSLVGRYFILLGQHSLVVFCASVLLAICGEAILFNDSGWRWQLVTQSIGSIALLLVAAVAAWNHAVERRRFETVRLPEPEPLERALEVA